MKKRSSHALRLPPLLLLLLLLLCAHATFGSSVGSSSEQAELLEPPAGGKCSEQEPPALLLIVGDVAPTRARILYDQLHGDADGFAIDVRVFMSVDAAPGASVQPHESVVVYEAQQELTVDQPPSRNGAPGVLELTDLTPNRMYSVRLRVVGNPAAVREEIVRFRTQMDPASPHEKLRTAADRVLVASCDRFVDDKDDTLWLQIAEDIEAHPASHFGMAHIGDQVYVDAGGASIPIVPVSAEVMLAANTRQLRERYDAVVDQFRAIYRRTFGRPAVQRALRNGAHWMIPDDHEVINNFNYERVQRVFNATADSKKPPSEANAREQQRHQEQLWGLALHYRAGLQVYYEFQFQLQRDFPFEQVDFLLEPDLGDILDGFPAFFAVEVHKLKLFFMDLRFDRSFFKPGDQRDQLVGEKQMSALKTTLERWSLELESAAVVLSTVPLFFHSPLSATITYFVEKETYPGMQAQLPGLQALFQVLAQHSNRQESPDTSTSSGGPLQLLVGGDVHFLAHSQVCGHYEADDARQRACVDQLITSGVTKGSTAISDTKLVPFYFLVTRLAPLCNSLLAWARLWVPRIPAPLWEIEYEKLFLGRNYGVIELSPSGALEWRSSVVVAHEEAYQDALQWLLDVSTSSNLGMLAFVQVLVAVPLLARRSRRKHARSPPKAKTS